MFVDLEILELRKWIAPKVKYKSIPVIFLYFAIMIKLAVFIIYFFWAAFPPFWGLSFYLEHWKTQVLTYAIFYRSCVNK